MRSACNYFSDEYANTINTFSRACDLDQMQYGCRIYNAQCRCGYGCSSEYRYNNNDDCKEALRGNSIPVISINVTLIKNCKRSDTCHRLKPCLNGGSCLQISSEPGFKCRCEGTGYYGPFCDKPCPGLNHLRLRGPFPYECVVI
ncbi:uncharacterized protein LOC116424320 isoform X2 [Nomia melanderi]|uniref:uncharacterized protein LOC116424320 isoform X2 n=1 Tax=Nomia melanderi TaxID=2448451 RepID=UPI0013044D77|nr:adhesive plaque matrix protein 2-like isoform X2 [Nomia melanderi]